MENLKKVLKTEYGIESFEDLVEAMKEFPGIDLGIFVGPIPGKEKG